jgi:hypothetical protein
VAPDSESVACPRRVTCVLRRRPWALVVAALLAVTACDGAADPTDTTEDPAATTTTTTVPPAGGRTPLQANEPPIVRQGDRGALVEALQFYLVCVGLEFPDPDGPGVTIDGSFGPITGFAVAYYQAQLRRAPSGNPDAATFASLARECSETRRLVFVDDEPTVEIAGNVAPGDDEAFTFDGETGQVLRLTAVEGAVTITVGGPGGDLVAEGSVAVEAELGAGQHVITVSASAPTTYRILAEIRSPNVLVSDFGPMALRGDGLGVTGAGLGADADNAAAVLSLIMSQPWADSGWRSDIAGCPGTHRVVTWVVQADPDNDRHPAVFVGYFAEVSAERRFLQYTYRSLDLTSLDPLAQRLATAEGISIGSSLARLVDAHGEQTIGPGGVVTVDGLTVVFDLVGDPATPDPELTRVRRISAGSGGCEELE